ncbi:hypothetical protein D3C75_978260 [compost metagenome]
MPFDRSMISAPDRLKPKSGMFLSPSIDQTLRSERPAACSMAGLLAKDFSEGSILMKLGRFRLLSAMPMFDSLPPASQ